MSEKEIWKRSLVILALLGLGALGLAVAMRSGGAFTHTQRSQR
jgi:hypothetical protein